MNGMAKTNTYLKILIINNLGYDYCLIGYHECYGFSWSFMYLSHDLFRYRHLWSWACLV
jgi:hypothetical protein